MVRNLVGLFSFLFSCNCFASSEFNFVPTEIWVKNPSEIIYAKADPDSQRLVELCVRLSDVSFSVPLEVLPESGMIDLHTIYISRSHGFELDQNGNLMKSSMFLSVHFEHEALSGEDSDARLETKVTLHFTDGKPENTAEVTEQLDRDDIEENGATSRKVPMVFHELKTCPVPASTEPG